MGVIYVINTKINDLKFELTCVKIKLIEIGKIEVFCIAV